MAKMGNIEDIHGTFKAIRIYASGNYKHKCVTGCIIINIYSFKFLLTVKGPWI
jgi:hypothetical protein